MRFYTTEQLSPRIAETPEGFLCCYDVAICRTGEMQYRDSEVPVTAKNGVVTIRRSEEEVFNDKTIASFLGKSITLDHPNTFVTPENWQTLAHGTIQNVRRGTGEQDDLLLADLLITTEKAIELVKAGLREVSCGYDAEYSEIEEGIGLQKDIIGNHLALVDKGRAGSRCRINDKKTICDHCGDCKGNCNIKQEEVDMKSKIKFSDKVKAAIKMITDAAAEVDETDEEKAAREAKEKETQDKSQKAKGNFIKDVEETEEEKKAREEAEKKTGDAESTCNCAELADRISKLEEVIAELVKSDEEVHAAMDAIMKDADEEEETPEKKAEKAAELAEIKAREKSEAEDKKKTKDDAEADQKKLAGAITNKDADETEEEKVAREAKEKEEKTADAEETEEEKTAREAKEKEATDKKTKDDAESDAKKLELAQTADEDESEEEKLAKQQEAEKKETMDSWNDIAYRVGLLAPEMNISKPTQYHKTVVEVIKREALKRALTTDSQMVEPFVKVKNINSLSGAQLDAAFVGASTLIAKINNTKVQVGRVKVNDAGTQVATSVRSINETNKNFWKR